MRAAIEVSCRVYRLILYAYPSRLRVEFGEDMVSVFEQQLIDAQHHGGFLRVCRVWAWALWETIQSGALASAGAALWGIGAVSLLGSSAMFLLFFWVTGFASRCVK